MHDYIALIRRKPSPSATPGWMHGWMHGLREALDQYRAPMVFLHGDGIDALGDDSFCQLAADSGVDWCACQTSLARRSSAVALPAAFRVATLSVLYQAVLSARRIDSVGLGGTLCCGPDLGSRGGQVSKRLLLEVGFAPADRQQRRETLEMALGAAALELDAVVLFNADGIEHLAGDEARGWRQITDFELLEMCIEGPAQRNVPEIPAQHMDAVQAAALRAGAGTILIL